MTHAFSRSLISGVRDGTGPAERMNAAPDIRSFQRRVTAWVTSTFRQTPAEQRDTRAYRALEEAIEAAQCSGVTLTQAQELTAHVYSKPPGERSSEYGAALLTLAALAEAYGHDLFADAEAELARISAPDIVERCRAKHAARNPDSALPGAPPSPPPTPEPDPA